MNCGIPLDNGCSPLRIVSFESVTNVLGTVFSITLNQAGRAAATGAAGNNPAMPVASAAKRRGIEATNEYKHSVSI